MSQTHMSVVEKAFDADLCSRPLGRELRKYFSLEMLCPQPSGVELSEAQDGISGDDAVCSNCKKRSLFARLQDARYVWDDSSTEEVKLCNACKIKHDGGYNIIN